MKKSEYIIRSFAHAAGVFAYVFAAAWGHFNADDGFVRFPLILKKLLEIAK